MEMKGTRLKIWVVIGCACIKSICLCQNKEIRGSRWEIQVEISLSKKDTKICYMYKYHKEKY